MIDQTVMWDQARYKVRRFGRRPVVPSDAIARTRPHVTKLLRVHNGIDVLPEAMLFSRT